MYKNKTMKGLNTNELTQVLNFIQEHHYFAAWKSDTEFEATKAQYPKMDDSLARHGFCIKYVDTCYDTRQGDVWMIKFRGISVGTLCFSTNHFNMIHQKPDDFKYERLFDWVMAYLRGEWSNKKILKDLEIKQ